MKNRMPGTETSEEQNEYVEDDFVVKDAEEEESVVEEKDDDSEFIEPLSDEDLELIQENKKKKKGRLKRKESSEVSDLEEEEGVGHAFEVEEEPLDEKEENELMQEIFDPKQVKEGYLGEVDQKIQAADVPERIQLRHLEASGELLEDFRSAPEQDEIIWIYERMVKEDAFVKDELVGSIKNILDIHRTENMEAMFIHTYRRHIISRTLTLAHYNRIIELDEEYQGFAKARRKLEEDLRTIPQLSATMEAVLR